LNGEVYCLVLYLLGGKTRQEVVTEPIAPTPAAGDTG